TPRRLRIAWKLGVDFAREQVDSVGVRERDSGCVGYFAKARDRTAERIRTSGFPRVARFRQASAEQERKRSANPRAGIVADDGRDYGRKNGDNQGENEPAQDLREQRSHEVSASSAESSLELEN